MRKFLLRNLLPVERDDSPPRRSYKRFMFQVIPMIASTIDWNSYARKAAAFGSREASACRKSIDLSVNSVEGLPGDVLATRLR